ncbi:hypothetical protein CRUP_035327, partial [Coryphaenoides rupestris]
MEKKIKPIGYCAVTTTVLLMFSDAGPSVVDLDFPEEVDHARLKCLRRWTEKRLNTLVITLPERDPYRLLYGTIPSLDADTAHPKLLLSDNNRRMVYGEAQRDCPEQEARFSSLPQVLASKAMDHGRWYWEVEVSSDDAAVEVGLCEPNFGQEGPEGSLPPGHNPNSWCPGRRAGQGGGHDDQSVCAGWHGNRLRELGVFLDCDGGRVVVLRRAPGGAQPLLHTYKQRFEEPLYPGSIARTV